MEVKFSYLHFFDDLCFLTGKGVFAEEILLKENFSLNTMEKESVSRKEKIGELS